MNPKKSKAKKGLIMDWIEFSRKGKPVNILVVDAVAYGLKDHFTEFHDKKTKIKTYRQAFGGRGVSTEDWKNYIQMCKKNEDKIIPWMQSWFNEFIKAKKFSEKLNRMNLEKKSNKELKSLFKKYFDLYVKVFAFTYDYRVLQEYYPQEIIAFLKEKVSNPKKLNNYMETILSLYKPIEMHKEKINLLKIAVKKRKGLSKGLFNKELKKHAGKFGFFGVYMYDGEPLTEKDFEKKMEKLIRKPVSKLEKELFEEKNRFKRNREQVKEMVLKLNLSEKEKQKIKNIRFALYASTLCDEYYSFVAFKMRPFMIETAKRFSLSFNQIVEMQNKELLSLFEKPLTKKHLDEINAREEGHALIFEKGKVRVLVGRELKEYSEPYLAELKKIQEMIEIQGETGFPGKVKGKVKLVNSMNDLPSFPKGYVLVAGTTLPQFVPAMKKAVAIITDEGGMLSHAAIMSREFKKPCVIGTKIATRVLKNNELIEIDAGKGIIRKVKA